MAFDLATAKPVEAPAAPRQPDVTVRFVREDNGGSGKFDLATAKPVVATPPVTGVPEGFEAPKEPPGWRDRANAVGTGVNAGVAGIVGMPVDAAANVIDLGKAALGYGVSKITGEAVPKALEVDSDRSNVIGSTEWIRKYLDQNKLTDTQMSRPDDVASRFIHAAFTAVPSLLTGRAPNSVPQALGHTLESMAVGTVPQAVAEAGGDAATQQAAGLLASAIPAARSSIPSLRGEKPPVETPRSNMTPEELAHTDSRILLDHGVELTNAQRGVGFRNKAAGEMGVAADTLLGPSDLKVKQGEQFTSAILRQGGQKGVRATPDALNEMQLRMQERYNKIHDEVPLILDERARADLESAWKDAADELGPNSNEAAALRKQIDNLYEKGQLTPEAKAAQEAAAKTRRAADKAASRRSEEAAARQADAEYARTEKAKADEAAKAQAEEARLAELRRNNPGQVFEPPQKPPEPPAQRVSEVEKVRARHAAEDAAAREKAIIEADSARVPAPDAPEAERVVSGAAAQRTREALGRMTLGDKGSLKHHAAAIQNALDNILERSAPDAKTANEIRSVREDYHRFKQIEEMAAGRKDGIITPARANQVLSRKRNRGEYVFGRGNQELSELVRAGQSRLSEFNDTGTARRGVSVGKVAAALTHPAEAAKVAGTIIAGRVINEKNAARGTPAGDAAYAEKQKKLQATALRRGAAGATANAARASESEDQRKRRQRAEALRK